MHGGIREQDGRFTDGCSGRTPYGDMWREGKCHKITWLFRLATRLSFSLSFLLLSFFRLYRLCWAPHAILCCVLRIVCCDRIVVVVISAIINIVSRLPIALLLLFTFSSCDEKSSKLI